MSSRQTFVERALAGDVLDLGAIDDEIAAWHESDCELSLHAWLGLTSEEYDLFAERAESLRVILAARRSGQDLRSLLRATDRDSSALAGRGASLSELARVREWMQKTGRL